METTENSGKKTADIPHYEAVASGVKEKETLLTPLGKAVAEAVKSVWKDILVPSFWAASSEGAKAFIDDVIPGAGNKAKNVVQSLGPGTSKVDYGGQYRRNDVGPYLDYRKDRAMDRYRYVDVSVRTLEEAEYIRDIIIEDSHRYDMIPVSELYELSGIPVDPMDSQYGWVGPMYKRDITIRRRRDGWMSIEMPEPERIGND